jgi:hypothetical protein
MGLCSNDDLELPGPDGRAVGRLTMPSTVTASTAWRASSVAAAAAQFGCKNHVRSCCSCSWVQLQPVQLRLTIKRLIWGFLQQQLRYVHKNKDIEQQERKKWCYNVS